MKALPVSHDEAASRLASIAAAVLLGGASSRMGTDKAQLTYEGMSYAGRITNLLGNFFETVYLVGGEAPADAQGQRIIDEEGPRCPLRGLVSVLEAAESERVLLVATDMPLVTAELVLALVAWPEADVVLPRTDYGLQPLCAIYQRESVLPCARRALEDNRLSLVGLLDEMRTSVLGGDELLQVDSGGRALLNVNTPEDRARLEQNHNE